MSELDHADALAAEYVLGTLDADERAQARALLARDGGFAAKVQSWERRLGELHLMVEPVEPDPAILARIKARMAEAEAQPMVPLPEPENIAPPPAAPLARASEGEPPSLDAIEAAISEAATVLSEDAARAPPEDGAPAPVAEAAPAPVADAELAPLIEATAAADVETAPAQPPDAAPARLAEEEDAALPLEADSAALAAEAPAAPAEADPGLLAEAATEPAALPAAETTPEGNLEPMPAPT
ncbi:MAG: hypothetical protein WBW74_28155, partial [Xanthobacteraceae bacterium]